MGSSLNDNNIVMADPASPAEGLYVGWGGVGNDGQSLEGRIYFRPTAGPPTHIAPDGSVVFATNGLYARVSGAWVLVTDFGGGSTVLSGTTSPDGVVTGVRGQLFVASTATQGNPTVYQNIDAVSGTTWKLIATAGPSQIGAGIVGSTTFTPTSASTTVVFNGALATDLALVTIQTDDTGTSLGAVLSATVTANQVVVTTANGAGLNNDAVVAILLVRP